MGNLKSSLLGALGFFVPTLILLTALNFINLPHIGSLSTGLVFSLYFSAIFFGGLYGGAWAFQFKELRYSKSYVPLIVGALMSDVVWAFITILWIVPFMRDTYVMVLNSVFINSLIIFFSGLAVSRINLGRVYTPAAE